MICDTPFVSSEQLEIGEALMAATLEERLARVEQLLEELVRKSERPKRDKDWRSTIGMFDGDPIMKEIIDAGRSIREQDRTETRT